MIIYTLECENNKYYVGKTNNLEQRWNRHINNAGSVWTKKYRPISILESFETDDSYDEDKQTIKMMAKYGIANVRGGTWTKVFLPKNQYSMLCKMITSQTDKCFKCKQDGHFVNDCPSNVFVETIEINHEPYKCFKCGERHNPWSAECKIRCWDFLTSCFKRGQNCSSLELELLE